MLLLSPWLYFCACTTDWEFVVCNFPSDVRKSAPYLGWVLKSLWQMSIVQSFCALLSNLPTIPYFCQQKIPLLLVLWVVSLPHAWVFEIFSCELFPNFVCFLTDPLWLFFSAFELKMSAKNSSIVNDHYLHYLPFFFDCEKDESLFTWAKRNLFCYASIDE